MGASEAYIIDAVRTPVGRRRGSLSTVHPADLGGHVLKSLMDRWRLMNPSSYGFKIMDRQCIRE